MSFCGDASIIQSKAGRWRAWAARCRSWRCPRCHGRRCADLRHLAAGGNPETFITLGCRPRDGEDRVARARRMVSAWRTLARRIKADKRLTHLEYLVVIEATKAGEPHMHILLRRIWIDQKWLSEQWGDLMNAPVVDIRRVRSRRGVASYVAKYVGKGPHQFGTLKRYYRSKRWDQRKRDNAAKEWWRGAATERVEVGINAICARWAQSAEQVLVAGLDFIEARSPPAGGALPFSLIGG